MRISRFFLNQPIDFSNGSGELSVLDADRIHYIRTVLRLNQNDRVTVFNGKGGEYSGAINHCDKKRVTITLDAFNPDNRALPIATTIGLSIIKRESMDNAIQKVTELGATRISPILSNRVSVSTKQIQSRQSHWQNIAISACEQSGLNLIPIIDQPEKLEDWCIKQYGLKFIADTSGPALQLGVSSPAESLSFLVGPEGGLTLEECAHAIKHGFIPVNLGARILRAETAALALMTLANQHLLAGS